MVLWPHDMNAHRLRPYPEPRLLRVTVQGLVYVLSGPFVFPQHEKNLWKNLWKTLNDSGFGGLRVFHSIVILFHNAVENSVVG